MTVCVQQIRQGYNRPEAHMILMALQFNEDLPKVCTGIQWSVLENYFMASGYHLYFVIPKFQNLSYIFFVSKISYISFTFEFRALELCNVLRANGKPWPGNLKTPPSTHPLRVKLRSLRSISCIGSIS